MGDSVRSNREFFTIAEVEAASRRRLPKSLFAALGSGSEGGLTARRNEESFDAVSFRPRAATVYDQRDLRTVVLGREMAFPVLTAPIGKVRIFHPQGAIGGVRATTNAGVVSVVTTSCGHSIEEVGAAAAGGRVWLQIGTWQDRNDAESIIERASSAGYEALVITVDSSVSPNPPAGRPVKIDLYNALNFGPELIVRPRWFYEYARDGMDLSLASVVSSPGSNKKGPLRPTWGDIEWIRDLWGGPVVVKGVITGDDAKRAVQAGASGVIVSNHGGKGLDGVPATFAALPEVVGAVGSETDVLLDGGIRTGGDVVKAVAMGAKATLIGRPFTWGLSVAGEDGVLRVLDIFREGIGRTLGLLGCPSIEAVDRTFVNVDALG
jgi:isopentenyl diphosphate isomerase/L-lactate dehydrogenase-like FMN-dependent dehydrogenase